MEKSWGYCKNKTENQRQQAKVQILRTPENSWLQGTLIDRTSSKASIPTMKPHTTQGPTSSRARYTMEFSSNTGTQPWASIYRLANHTKPTDISKPTTGHFIALQTGNPAPPTRTPTKASLTRKPWQAISPIPPPGPTSTIKRNHKLPGYRKATPTQQCEQDENAEKYSTGKGKG